MALRLRHFSPLQKDLDLHCRCLLFIGRALPLWRAAEFSTTFRFVGVTQLFQVRKAGLLHLSHTIGNGMIHPEEQAGLIPLS